MVTLICVVWREIASGKLDTCDGLRRLWLGIFFPFADAVVDMRGPDASRPTTNYCASVSHAQQLGAE